MPQPQDVRPRRCALKMETRQNHGECVPGACPVHCLSASVLESGLRSTLPKADPKLATIPIKSTPKPSLQSTSPSQHHTCAMELHNMTYIALVHTLALTCARVKRFNTTTFLTFTTKCCGVFQKAQTSASSECLWYQWPTHGKGACCHGPFNSRNRLASQCPF